MLVQGHGAEAIRWLDRACRLVPGDPALQLALAVACVGRDNRRACELFTALSDACGVVRDVWLGLAGTHHAVGDHAAAAKALKTALSRHRFVPEFITLADAVARATGAPGWCGIASDSDIFIALADHRAVAELIVGGCGKMHAVSSGRHRMAGLLAAGSSLSVVANGRHLLGSPLDLAAFRRIEGVVWSPDGGLGGWAWQPGDPEADPVLTVRAAAGRTVQILASEPSGGSGGLGRPRGFSIPSSRLADLRGRLRVQGGGHDLLGSPIDPEAERREAHAAARALSCLFPAGAVRSAVAPADIPPAAIPIGAVGQRPTRRSRLRRREVDVVIPVHDAAAETLACIDSVLASIEAPSRVIVVDDGSRDPALRRALDNLAAQRRIHLLRHSEPLGFPTSANAGLRAPRGRDVVLLNSDTLVAPGWLAGLREAAYASADIGTATPFSNSGTIVSYPGPAERNAMPDANETRRLSALARRVNRDGVVELPVAIGFCMYIRRDCLDDVGLFRTDVFAQGYGEENDFCLRARNLGWHHVAATGVFVAHSGGRSFGPARHALLERNQLVLGRLHPGYTGLIADWAAKDPLAEPRRRFDVGRWRAARPRRGEAVVLISHAQGGGVEQCVSVSSARHRAAGRRCIVLRPDSDAVVVGDEEGTYPNLRYRLPQEEPALLRLLRSEHPVEMELHHLLDHKPAILDLISRLALPYDVHIHDYSWICPRVILIGADRRYCGEPDATACDACVADTGSAFDEIIPVAVMRRRSARILQQARRVLVPSDDAATRMRRHFPDLRPTVVPHEEDLYPPPDRPALAPNGRCRVCIVGSIGVAKGYDVLLGCARDAATRDLPLEFIVVGHTIDDRRLMVTGRLFVTGEFRPHEAQALIRSQKATLGLIPSIWPETWCFALSDLWRAGLSAAAFDIGAPAERIRRTGRGVVLPLGLRPKAINDALLTAALQSVRNGAPVPRWPQPDNVVEKLSAHRQNSESLYV